MSIGSDDCSSELVQLIEQELDTGRYASPGEVLLDAMKLLRERHGFDAEIQTGVDQLARGEFVEYDREGLKAMFAELRSRIHVRTGVSHE